MENAGVKMMRVIVCRPCEAAEITEVCDDIEALQSLVGGPIQEWMPFHSESDKRWDDIVIVSNAESKMLNLRPCRAIYDENGELLDVIVGPFLICYAPICSEHYDSLPPDLEEEFLQKFMMPERFVRTDEGTQVIKYDQNESVGNHRNLTVHDRSEVHMRYALF